MPAKKVKHRKVPLAGIKTLTLRAGQLTTGRRGEPVRECFERITCSELCAVRSSGWMESRKGME